MERKVNFWKQLSCTAASCFFIFCGASAQMPSRSLPSQFRSGNNNTYNVDIRLISCRLSNENYTDCTFIVNLNSEKDIDIYFQPNLISGVLPNGTVLITDNISLGSYNGGAFTSGSFESRMSPKIDYTIIGRFKDKGIPNFNQWKYLDIGNKEYDRKFARIENVPILGRQQPVTPLPAPQPALNPKQYLTFNATNGYGTLSGVSLNGGLYDVNLQGCRPTDGGMAACTLTLTPMRATAQDVTLEDLNVAVNGAAVTATATAMPTVMTLTVTAPVNVNRIDELRLGNARFLNVGVK